MDIDYIFNEFKVLYAQKVIYFFDASLRKLLSHRGDPSYYNNNIIIKGIKKQLSEEFKLACIDCSSYGIDKMLLVMLAIKYHIDIEIGIYIATNPRIKVIETLRGLLKEKSQWLGDNNFGNEEMKYTMLGIVPISIPESLTEEQINELYRYQLSEIERQLVFLDKQDDLSNGFFTNFNLLPQEIDKEILFDMLIKQGVDKNSLLDMLIEQGVDLRYDEDEDHEQHEDHEQREDHEQHEDQEWPDLYAHRKDKDQEQYEDQEWFGPSAQYKDQEQLLGQYAHRAAEIYDDDYDDDYYDDDYYDDDSLPQETNLVNSRELVLTLDRHSVSIWGMAHPRRATKRRENTQVLEEVAKLAPTLISLHEDLGVNKNEKRIFMGQETEQPLEYYEVTLQDFTAPTFDQYNKTYNIVVENARRNRNVAIHCGEGYGRTGVILSGLFLQAAMEQQFKDNPAIFKEYNLEQTAQVEAEGIEIPCTPAVLMAITTIRQLTIKQNRYNTEGKSIENELQVKSLLELEESLVNKYKKQLNANTSKNKDMIFHGLDKQESAKDLNTVEQRTKSVKDLIKSWEDLADKNKKNPKSPKKPR